MSTHTSFDDLTWDGHDWRDPSGYIVKGKAVVDPNAPKDRTGAKIGVSLLVTPVALALGLVTYFVVGLLFMGPFLSGLNGTGTLVEESTAYEVWLLVSVGGTIAGAWALVWRLMR